MRFHLTLHASISAHGSEDAGDDAWQMRDEFARWIHGEDCHWQYCLRGRNTDGLFATTDAAPSSLVEAKREGRVVNVSNAGHPILQYQAEPADLPRPSIKPIYKRGGRIHPTEPFVCYAPSQIGDWEIAPGNPYVSRYRFIAQDGPPNAAELERLWQDYTHPPQVKIESQ